MIKLRYSTWDGKVHLRVLAEGRTSLGRTVENDVVVDDLSVSGRHCEFEVLGDNLGTFAIRIEAAGGDGSEGRPAEGEAALPAQLEDGTYSCMRHRETRAEFECDRCYMLFCGECFSGKGTDAGGTICPSCGRELRVLDWSGMERTRGDVVKDLLPEEVKKVLRRWQGFRRGKGE